MRFTRSGESRRFSISLHDRAADDGRVREPPHRTHLFRSRDSESDCDGQIADSSCAFYEGFSIACHFIARACYASARHCVDESVRLLRDSRESFVRSCWRDQKDRIESMLKQVLSPRLCFLRNQICHEHSVDPGLSRCRRRMVPGRIAGAD